MDKTVVELFAGVGGFRCGLNSIKEIEDTKYPEKWKTVWFSQWEPNKRKQWAHDCYVNRFGLSYDLNNNDTTNMDIAEVDKVAIPDHNLLVGGFPCQDYSVARGLSGEKGIEGKKGVLWWSILDVVKAKKAPFILLENVDRLIKSPSKQRGRDFGIILACLKNEGYSVEWRVINAAEYGEVQRRRRTFIFAYKNKTNFGTDIIDGLQNISFKNGDEIYNARQRVKNVLSKSGFFAQCFPIVEFDENKIKCEELENDVVNVSDEFMFLFENAGIMVDGIIYTVKTMPIDIQPNPIKNVLLEKEAEKQYFIDENRLYYTSHDIRHSNETQEDLPKESRRTWQYIKGGKKRLRTSKTGHQYYFSEGPMSMIDEWDMPARTMLTSESSFNRSTHIVRDRVSEQIRLLTPVEAERIQGFPDNWTKESLVDGEIIPMPEKMRYFCMGNALVVPLITKMEKVLDEIFDKE